MFCELSNSRSEFRSNYDDSMADSIFAMSLINSSPMSDLSYDLVSGSNSDDFNGVGYYDGMIDDLLLPHYIKYDIEKQPQLLNLVSPNDILPVETPMSVDSLTGAFIRTDFADNLLFDDPLDIDSDGSSILPESLEQVLCGVTDQFLSDKVFNEMNESGTDFDTMLEEDILPSITLSDSDDDSSIIEEIPKNAEQVHPPSGTMGGSTYKVDIDHCYYTKFSEVKDEDDKEMRFLDMNDVWVSIGSPDSSGSSSEVDVVTVTEELQAPFVPKVQATYRNKRQKRGLNSQKAKKNQSPSLSSKTFNAAMKRNMKRITSIRRTHRRKINNSVETTPSNSLPSSAPSSRCSSDGEDSCKRKNHNKSERRRRDQLRDNLQNLRINVPAVQNHPKTAKVNILNSARTYIRDLERDGKSLCSEMKNYKNRHTYLRTRLKKLRSEITERNRQFWQEMWLPSSNL